MKKNNKGLSIVELLVVVAIMAVTITVGVTSISYVIGTAARECASGIDNAISKCRIETMSKRDIVLEVSKTAEGTFVLKTYDAATMTAAEVVGLQGDTIGKKGVKIQYSTKENTDLMEVTGTQTIKLSFDRSTGALEQVDGNTVNRIVVTKGGVTKTITIIPETGKHSIS